MLSAHGHNTTFYQWTYLDPSMGWSWSAHPRAGNAFILLIFFFLTIYFYFIFKGFSFFKAWCLHSNTAGQIKYLYVHTWACKEWQHWTTKTSDGVVSVPFLRVNSQTTKLFISSTSRTNSSFPFNKDKSARWDFSKKNKGHLIIVKHSFNLWESVPKEESLSGWLFISRRGNQF